MALLNILQFPDPRLKQKATVVDIFDQDIFKLVNDMTETMYKGHGVGLAATQVNVLKRVIVIDVTEAQNAPLCLINPEITAKRDQVELEEGCLSFQGVYAKVKRSKEVDVTFYDALGKIHQISAQGLLSICIQHEIDHLDGITFYDYLSPLKQSMLRKRLEKFQRHRR